MLLAVMAMAMMMVITMAGILLAVAVLGAVPGSGLG
jgi:hypothetical protein